jgi:hypothetical protein
MGTRRPGDSAELGPTKRAGKMPSAANLARIRSVRGTTANLVWCGLLLACSAGLSGCESFEKLRRLFHPEEAPGEGLGNAGLRVEVEPADGISILLDGVRVASVSPYVNRKLRAGPHEVEVRAMGYYSVTLPVILEDHKLTAMPVALRIRPTSDPKVKPVPQPKTKAPEPPPTPSPVLPAGAPKVTLTFALSPEQSVTIDRVNVVRHQATIERVAGELTIGPMIMRYQVGGAGLLTLTVPNDGATWSKDGAPIKAGAQFRINQGAVRLRRTASSGDEQTVVIRR